MTKKQSLECMELIRTALERVHNMPPEKVFYFPEEPDEFRRGMLYSFTRSMAELAGDRIRRSTVPAADPGFKEKVAFARRQLESLNERKRDILLYALISQPKRWLQVPEPSGEGERQRAKIDFLQRPLMQGCLDEKVEDLGFATGRMCEQESAATEGCQHGFRHAGGQHGRQHCIESVSSCREGVAGRVGSDGVAGGHNAAGHRFWFSRECVDGRRPHRTLEGPVRAAYLPHSVT